MIGNLTNNIISNLTTNDTTVSLVGGSTLISTSGTTASLTLATNGNTASANIAIGSSSLFSNTTGYSNTALGTNSLLENKDGGIYKSLDAGKTWKLINKERLKIVPHATMSIEAKNLQR